MQHLHLIGFYNVSNLQLRAISCFVNLVVGWYSLPRRLGRHRRQLATRTLLKENAREKLISIFLLQEEIFREKKQKKLNNTATLQNFETYLLLFC